MVQSGWRLQTGFSVSVSGHMSVDGVSQELPTGTKPHGPSEWSMGENVLAVQGSFYSYKLAYTVECFEEVAFNVPLRLFFRWFRLDLANATTAEAIDVIHFVERGLRVRVDSVLEQDGEAVLRVVGYDGAKKVLEARREKKG